VVETEGPLSDGAGRPAREPDMTLLFPAHPNWDLYIEWSGAGHPLTDEIRMLVWFNKVEQEPHATVQISPHQAGYVVYVNDPTEYYEIWKSGDLHEDGGWLIEVDHAIRPARQGSVRSWIARIRRHA